MALTNKSRTPNSASASRRHTLTRHVHLAAKKARRNTSATCSAMEVPISKDAAWKDLEEHVNAIEETHLRGKMGITNKRAAQTRACASARLARVD